ncbi:protein TolQ [Alterisphingorhabdus coralli]|uniref:Protein TolQ n=1 Tax=Alterisphingorhabdus coralli TaxID=3071408 RepID=A0AA97F911_9SPHN|nr:protein TolQ [Parasphingorhabdus sp. SCSIO 66989]WOE75756.1 protein TolQ [Parasphingorhabdus sp. SCSIO 66989]
MLDQMGLSTETVTLSPIALFMEADIIVKLVMIGLALASIWTWTIIFSVAGRLRGARRDSEKYEADFWKTDDIDAFYKTRGDDDIPAAKVLSAGVDEWRRSTSNGKLDREGTRQRLSTVMNASVTEEIDRMSERLNFLATVGSVAPFVGLFGTVWGIMRSFSAIAAEQNSSLAVVAPGIAEALFATAIGLFAAIPAVIAYNRFSHKLNMLEARLFRFADGFHATLSRELEKGA